ISLIQAGLYGDPEESLALNLRRAFRDFQLWCRENKVQCSQVPWTTGTGMVVKKGRNVLMSHKAFNERMIVEYLAECCERVVDQNLPGNSRAFGQWLCEQVLQGKREWPSPSNPEFGLAATCLKSIARWFNLCERNGRYLTAKAAKDIGDAGKQFIDSHLLLSFLEMRSWVRASKLLTTCTWMYT
ncbi:unnamed protein product, partial [Cladocopium goreaui]